MRGSRFIVLPELLNEGQNPSDNYRTRKFPEHGGEVAQAASCTSVPKHVHGQGSTYSHNVWVVQGQKGRHFSEQVELLRNILKKRKGEITQCDRE
jgi:hypothetical protein